MLLLDRPDLLAHAALHLEHRAEDAQVELDAEDGRREDDGLERRREAIEAGDEQAVDVAREERDRRRGEALLHQWLVRRLAFAPVGDDLLREEGGAAGVLE